MTDRPKGICSAVECSPGHLLAAMHPSSCKPLEPDSTLFNWAVVFHHCREVGYNHYKGRMGWEMPNTAAMLAKHRPEDYVFHWGLGTLTHYKTAELLYKKPVTS